MKMTTSEVAKEMGISIQLVRSLAKKGKLPFAIVNDNPTNKSYYFDRERFKAYKEGRI